MSLYSRMSRVVLLAQPGDRMVLEGKAYTCTAIDYATGKLCFVADSEDAPAIPTSVAQELTRSLTDDQLRAECHRRGIATETGEDMSRNQRECLSVKEQLRVACEKWKADVADRDEWKRRAEASERELKSVEPGLRQKLAEWRERAEAAEGQLNDPRRCLRIVDDDEYGVVPVGSVHDCGRIEVLVTRVDGERLPGFHSELGPSIAAKPVDSSHWFDPIDLLADDE